MTTAVSTLRGGEFLLQPSDPSAVFTPEQRTDEHRMIGDTVRDFVNNEVLPVLDRLEQKDWGKSIPLGGTAEFEGRPFTVIGFMVRSVEFEGVLTTPRITPWSSVGASSFGAWVNMARARRLTTIQAA